MGSDALRQPFHAEDPAHGLPTREPIWQTASRIAWNHQMPAISASPWLRAVNPGSGAGISECATRNEYEFRPESGSCPPIRPILPVPPSLVGYEWVVSPSPCASRSAMRLNASSSPRKLPL